MTKFIEIKLSGKATLYLTERELLDGLDPSVYIAAIKRGKAFSRSRKMRDHKPKLAARDKLF